MSNLPEAEVESNLVIRSNRKKIREAGLFVFQMSILREQLDKRTAELHLICTQTEEYKAVLYLKRFLRQLATGKEEGTSTLNTKSDIENVPYGVGVT